MEKCFEILESFLTVGGEPNAVRTGISNRIGMLSNKETTIARYVLDFFEKYLMYLNSTISEKELLIKLRDFILFTHRLKPNEQLKTMVTVNGVGLGLFVDADGYLNATFKLPEWFKDDAFVANVYKSVTQDVEPYTIGDDYLSQITQKFSTYKSFELKIAVHAALNLEPGYSLIASLPTGAGKSLITHGITCLSNGLTIVIVPTVALAMDQYQAALSTLGEKYTDAVFYYDGQQSDKEFKTLMDGLEHKTLKLLLISPEAILKNTRLNQKLDECAQSQYLANVVIDEAHIVPDWGVLFRPDFQLFSFVLRRWKALSENQIRTYMLSATLPDETIELLKKLFAPDGNVHEIRCDALRKEPQFCFYECKSISKRYEQIEQMIELLPKPMIIYFMTPEEVKFFSKHLKAAGYKNIRAFHGDTKKKERLEIIRDWKDNRIDVVLGTSAFGIGVDKPNVKTVIHACVPENLSRFYQEVGRAGRDGMMSLSVFMPYTGKEKSDSDVTYNHIKGLVLRVPTMVNRWFGMMRASITSDDIMDLDTAATPTNFSEEEAEYAGERNSTWNINLLLFLQRIGYIDIFDVYFQNESKSYHMKIRVLCADVLSDPARMAQMLEEPRANELSMQMSGYQQMRDVVLYPKKSCWGKRFQRLYPLTQECCNGCPVHNRNTFISDDEFKIRNISEFTVEPKMFGLKLSRMLRNNQMMIVRNPAFPYVDVDILKKLVGALNSEGVSVFVAPLEFLEKISFSGLKLTVEEFCVIVRRYPALLAGGVVAVFDGNTQKNDALFSDITKLTEHGYKAVLFCSDSMYIPSVGRRLTDFLDCRIRDVEDWI